MRKILFAGVLAFAALALLTQFSLTVRAAEFDAQGNGAQAAIDIDRIKSVLRLTPAQERYWHPVEAALRGLARHQAHAQTEDAGFVRRISGRVLSIVLNSAAIERLAVAARPLLGVLNEEQKQAARGLAQEMGLGPVVAALN